MTSLTTEPGGSLVTIVIYPHPLTNRRYRASNALRPPLHHPTNLLTYLRLLQRPRPLHHHHTLTPHVIHRDHLLGIPVHDDIGVVRHHDHLSAAFVVTDLADDQVVDHVVVEIVFGLVEHDGLVAVGEE